MFILISPTGFVLPLFTFSLALICLSHSFFSFIVFFHFLIYQLFLSIDSFFINRIFSRFSFMGPGPGHACFLFTTHILTTLWLLLSSFNTFFIVLSCLNLLNHLNHLNHPNGQSI